MLEELSELGIEPAFEHVAVREAVFFGPDGREHVYRSARPAFYLVRRGSDRGTLDTGLKSRCVDEGVDFRFLQRRDHLPRGGVVAQGPHAIVMMEKITGRQLGAPGREIVATTIDAGLVHPSA